MNRGIGRSSALLASGTVVSRVLGFVRVAVLTVAVGNVGSTVGDAYQAATIVPNSIYALIGGGLLTAVLVPQIVRASIDRDGGAAYINKLVTLAVVAFGVITIAVTIAAPVLMHLYVSKPSAVPIATAFALWSLPQVFFLGLYTVLGEVLNARRSFGPYTWAPVLNNVVGITTLVLFIALFGSHDGAHPDRFSAAMVALVGGGATLGLACQALILTLAWRRTGLRFRPDFQWRGVNLGATGRVASWTFGMLVASQVAGLIETRIAFAASGDGNASVMTMSTAWLVFMLPHSVITVSIITVFYPRMSEHAAVHDLASLRADVGQAMRIVLLLLVMADAALLAAAQPFARLFTDSPGHTGAMSAVMVAYLLGLIPFSALFVVQRCFYALSDTRTPFIFTMIQVVLVIGGTLLCTLLPDPDIARGIALSVSIAGTVQLVVAMVLLRRRIGGLGGAAVQRLLIRCGIAALPALAAGLSTAALLGAFRDGGWAIRDRPEGFASTVAVGMVVAVVYLATLAALRTPELGAALDLVTARVRPRGIRQP